MSTTPLHVLDSVVRSVCGHSVDQCVRLTGGEVNETYRVQLAAAGSVVIRIARQPVPWFTDEEHIMAQARAVGVPTPEVVGVEHLEHDGELLSFSIQRVVAGRSLDELTGEVPGGELEQLVVNSGELLARVHSIVADRGVRHELQPPDDPFVARRVGIVERAHGPAAALVVERGAEWLVRELAARPAPAQVLAHSDWLPKHFLIDGGAIAGVIDWERAGPASPAFDFACWELFAGGRPHYDSALLRLGYSRVADPDSATDGWVPAFVVDWALEVLGWVNPARPALLRRCVDVIARYAGG